MLERAVKPINKRRDTACARNKYTTFLKHNVMTIFVILKSGTKYTRGGGGLFFRRIKFFFLLLLFISGSKWVKCRVVSCKFPL